jgi:hypothetical protein
MLDPTMMHWGMGPSLVTRQRPRQIDRFKTLVTRGIVIRLKIEVRMIQELCRGAISRGGISIMCRTDRACQEAVAGTEPSSLDAIPYR